MSGTSVEPVLRTENMYAAYGRVPVLRDINIQVRPGEIVGLLGPNGAGKTTTLLSVSGDKQPTRGKVFFDGRDVTTPLHKRARHGLAYVTEERSVFMGLSTRDNLRVGGCDENDVYAMFPELKPLASRRAGLLSGGEQQILTVARALVRRPKLMLADEMSLGLAPLIVARLLSALRTAADQGLGVLLVEQHVRQVLKTADRVYVMRRGEVVLEGTADEMSRNLDELEKSYLSGPDIEDESRTE